MTAIEFAYTLLFWLLTVALIVKSLSSEKNYLLLWHASLQFSKKNTWSFKFLVLLSRFRYFLLSRRQPYIIFEDDSHGGHAHIYVFSHLACRSLWIPPYPFTDSFNHFLWSSKAWYPTPRTVFRCTKFLKSIHNMVHRGPNHFQ